MSSENFAPASEPLSLLRRLCLGRSSFSNYYPSPVEQCRYCFFSSKLASTIHGAGLNDLMAPGVSFRALLEHAQEGGFWWLDVVNPSEEELIALSKAFSFHPLNMEDIPVQKTRERVELFKQYRFFCFRSLFQMNKVADEQLNPQSLYLIVFQEGILSFAFCQSPHATNVRRKISQLRDSLTLSSGWICYALL